MKVRDYVGGKYLLLEEIGEGGMGKVFKVQSGEEFFALKICTEIEEENIKRFKREVRLMSKIKHENVIEVLDFDLDNDPPYFVMPLCKFSIDDKIDKLKDNPKLALDMLMKVCNGVNALHLSGIIHRDIKPKNILISLDLKVKVSDLGLGKFEKRDSSILTSSNVYMGTQGYIPTEFLKPGGTKNANVQSDIYQLGKTIYNIFTGNNPILIEKDIIPGGLLYIIQKCIADNPSDRYKTVGHLENALSNYLLSLDPNSNPQNAFDNQINVSRENLKANQYDKDNLENIIQILFGFKDEPELFFSQFHKIDGKILEVIASNMPNLCSRMIDEYSKNLKRYFNEHFASFSDAELVAKSMNHIFKESKDLSSKIQAMENTLYASAVCNRYSAMSVFDTMIQSIKNDQEAVSVVEMLRENIEYYERVADRVPSSRLNHVVKQLQKEILAAAAKRNQEQESEFNIDDL